MKNQKLKVIATLSYDEQGKLDTYALDHDIGDELLQLENNDLSLQLRQPVKIDIFLRRGEARWLFRNKVVLVPDPQRFTDEEAALLVQQHVLDTEEDFRRMKEFLGSTENQKRIPSVRRERIQDLVRIFVWKRDEGKCVKCGSQEKLEFDHIIPVAEGGSNTERNIQLLCEQCNRQKGKSVSWRINGTAAPSSTPP